MIGCAQFDARRVCGVWLALAAAGLTFVLACGCERAALRARPVVFQGVYNGPAVTALKSGSNYSVVFIAPTQGWRGVVDLEDARPLLNDVYVTLRRPATDDAGVGEPFERRLATKLSSSKSLRVNVRVVGPEDVVTEREPPYVLIETVSP